MAVEAVYKGKQNDGYYWVNVRNKHPKGLIGDAGVMRRFENDDQAKSYAESVNKTGTDTFNVNNEQKPMPVLHEGDVFVKSANN